MATKGPLCGYTKADGDKCRNPDKDGMGCYQHYGMVGGLPEEQVRRMRDAHSALEGVDQRLHVVPLAAVSPTQAFRENVLNGSPIAPDALDAVQEAMGVLVGGSPAKGDDQDISSAWTRAGLDVPARADEATARFPQFAAALHARLGERVSLLRVAGFHRRTQKGMVQNNGEMMTHAMVIDRHQPTETVVDPFIASYAPVRDRNAPVDDQIASGMTPFGDVPWIGSLNEYVNGDHMWWTYADEPPISTALQAAAQYPDPGPHLADAGRTSR